MTAIEADAPAAGVAPRSLRSELSPYYERSQVVPVAMFVLPFAAWLTLLWLGLRSDRVVIHAAISLPLALAGGQLFMIGHDAAHGSHSPSRFVNEVVGRLALMPSLHVFGLWRFHHDTHHRYTNLRGHDFVWTPVSPDEYRQLSPWRKRAHRVYRNRTGLGLGLHYAIEIWGPRMVWPHRGYNFPKRKMLFVDTALLLATVIALGAGGYGIAGGAGSAASGSYWASVGLFLVVIPVVVTHWLIGFVIFFNHTHPDIVWYDDPSEWSQRDVQLEGSAGQRFPGAAGVFGPRIMNHTAHHVNPRVPLRHLGRAQRCIVAIGGDRATTYDWSVRAIVEVLDRCKLYDYEAKRWVGYDVPAGSR